MIVIVQHCCLIDKLRKYFNQYGRVQDAVVMKDPVSRRSRGFGFITFFDVDSLDNALDHAPHILDARKVCSLYCIYVDLLILFITHLLRLKRNVLFQDLNSLVKLVVR